MEDESAVLGGPVLTFLVLLFENEDDWKNSSWRFYYQNHGCAGGALIFSSALCAWRWPLLPWFGAQIKCWFSADITSLAFEAFQCYLQVFARRLSSLPPQLQESLGRGASYRCIKGRDDWEPGGHRQKTQQVTMLMSVNLSCK